MVSQGTPWVLSGHPTCVHSLHIASVLVCQTWALSQDDEKELIKEDVSTKPTLSPFFKM